MDMGGMDTGMMPMRPYLHFTGGDPLWFQAWVPTSPGAIAGACIGLAMLAMFERLLVGMRAVLEAEWERRSHLAVVEGTVEHYHTDLPTSIDPSPTNEPPSQHILTKGDGELSVLPVSQYATHSPFIPSHDVARGIVYLAQATIAYILALAVMTWNASYTTSILIGLGVGETLFGRLDRARHRLPHVH